MFALEVERIRDQTQKTNYNLDLNLRGIGHEWCFLGPPRLRSLDSGRSTLLLIRWLSPGTAPYLKSSSLATREILAFAGFKVKIPFIVVLLRTLAPCFAWQLPLGISFHSLYVGLFFNHWLLILSIWCANLLVLHLILSFCLGMLLVDKMLNW